jgi:hypothetical protein
MSKGRTPTSAVEDKVPPPPLFSLSFAHKRPVESHLAVTLFFVDCNLTRTKLVFVGLGIMTHLECGLGFC